LDKERKRQSGEEIILTANAVAFSLAACLNDFEIAELCELLGLVRHDLDIIRYRRK
jgi:hypothetical protein